MVVSPCHGEMCSRVQILATADGGRHWRLQGGLSRPDATTFVSPTAGFTLRDACHGRRCVVSVWSTADGGRSWQRRGGFAYRPHPYRLDLQGAAVLDIATPRVYWIAFGGLLERSTDAGASWSRESFRCPRGYASLFSVSFSDAEHGVAGCSWGQGAAGSQGKEVFTTADAGATWRLAATSGSRGALSMYGYGASLESVTPARGYLVTERDGLAVTTDGWRSTRPLLVTDDEAIMTGTTWPTPHVGYVVAEGELFSSSDGGRTWRQVYPRPVAQPRASVTFLTVLGERRPYGIAGGSSAYSFQGGPSEVLSTRSGAVWTGIAVLPAPIQTVLHSGRTVYALTETPLGSSRLFRSTDGGQRWSETGRVPSSTWMAAAGGSLFLESSQGRLLHATDGRHWRAVFSHRLWDVEFTSAHDGVALGRSSRILHTTDGGARWTPLPRQPDVPDIEAITALGTHVWAIGGTCTPRPCRGELAWTPDLGRHWQVISYPRVPGTSYGQLVFTSPRVGYLVQDGRTLRTTDGGRIWALP